MTDELASPETADRVLRLMDRQSRDGLVAVSLRDLALELSIGRSTAQRAIRLLLQREQISIARLGTGHLFPTTYRLGSGDPT